jgi:hypothetical protein
MSMVPENKKTPEMVPENKKTPDKKELVYPRILYTDLNGLFCKESIGMHHCLRLSS